MYARLGKGSARGTSVLAALMLIAVLGVAAALLQYASHSGAIALSPQVQTAAATVPAATPAKQTNQCPAQTQADQDKVSTGSGTNVTCLPGQVHKIDMTKATGGTQQDQVSDCLVQQTDPKTGKPVTSSSGQVQCIKNPKETSNKDCALAQPTQCVVEYCPPNGNTLSTNGGCFVVKQCTNATCVSNLTSGYLQNEYPAYVAAEALANNPQTVVLPSTGDANGAQWLTQALSNQSVTGDNGANPSAQATVASQLQQWSGSDLNDPLTTTASEVSANSAPCVSGTSGCTPAAQLNSNLGTVAGPATQTPPTTPPAQTPPAQTPPAPAPAAPPAPQTGSTIVPPGNGNTNTSQVQCVLGMNGQPSCGLGLNNNSNSSTGLNGLMQDMMMANMLKSLLGQQTPTSVPPGNQSAYPAGSCNAQYTCSGNQLYYQQNTCVQQPYQNCQNGCDPSGTSCAATSPYGTGTNGQACTAPVPQPDPSTCTTGSWMPISANGCQNTSWQCVPSSANAPTASLSCSPQTADVGQSVSIKYSCQNAVSDTGGGFSTGGSLSGTASTSITAPPTGTNTATYTLTCTNSAGQTQGAQCNVQINQPSIVLVANPSSVPSGQSATIGWVTAGIQSCAITASPDTGGFNAANQSNTTSSGVATLSNITGQVTISLACKTLGGGTKTATTVVNAGGATTQPLSVSSSADGASAAHGGNVTVTWNSTNAPSGSALSLWLVDEQTQSADALIAGAQPTSGSYNWTIPAIGSTCVSGAANVCATDLVAGDSYAVEAILYTPQNAYVGDGVQPASPVQPTYGASAVGGTFTISQ